MQDYLQNLFGFMMLYDTIKIQKYRKLSGVILQQAFKTKLNHYNYSL